jgi:hypothetical protein
MAFVVGEFELLLSGGRGRGGGLDLGSWILDPLIGV